jgi:hypothetical protein
VLLLDLLKILERTIDVGLSAGNEGRVAGSCVLEPLQRFVGFWSLFLDLGGEFLELGFCGGGGVDDGFRAREVVVGIACLVGS